MSPQATLALKTEMEEGFRPVPSACERELKACLTNKPAVSNYTERFPRHTQVFIYLRRFNAIFLPKQGPQGSEHQNVPFLFLSLENIAAWKGVSYTFGKCCRSVRVLLLSASPPRTLGVDVNFVHMCANTYAHTRIHKTLVRCFLPCSQ